MRRWRPALVALSLALAVGPAALPVQADDGDHPGRYIPSPESRSKNMRLLAELPRTRTDPTYRNSDLAFWGNLAYAGNYEGFRIIDISDPESPVTLVDYACPGAQHDVSVWEDLLFLSIDAPRTGPGCASAPAGIGFEGIRVFEVSDPANPVFVTGVATDCGSHTHTLVPDTENGRVLLHVASYPASSLGPTPYGTECTRQRPDGSQGHSKISVVEVPLDAPELARVVAEPTVPLNDRNGIPGYRGCHDITVFTGLDLAAAACLNEGQLWDISDPVHPRTIARIHNPAIEIWHSASFTWDGEIVAFGDEAGGGTSPRCRASDASTVGAIWFYRVADLDNMDGSTVAPPLSHFKIPRPQGDQANCTAHNFNFIPTTRGYTLVSSWYAGGTNVIDASDPANPRELAHLDPHGANTWSSYWYNNFIYTNDGGRGVDVMLYSGSGRAGAKRLPHFNPQTQESTL